MVSSKVFLSVIIASVLVLSYQTYLLFDLTSRLGEANISFGGSAAAASSEAPNMVGGC